mgnify:CR=1 FL=1
MKTKWDALIKKYDVAYQEELKALKWKVKESCIGVVSAGWFE